MSDKNFSLDWPHGYITDTGKPARIICTDRQHDYPVLALIKQSDGSEALAAFNLDGIGAYTRLTNKQPEPVVVNKYWRIAQGLNLFVPSVEYATLDEALNGNPTLYDTIGVLCAVYHDGVLVDVQHVANMEDTAHLRNQEK